MSLRSAKEALEAKNTENQTDPNQGFNYSPFQQGQYQNVQNAWEQRRKLVESLCKKIKEERKKQGLSQRQLAYKSGYSQGTITRAETRGWISFSCLVSLVAALDKTLTLTDIK